MINKQTQQKRGFALLLTLVVVSVVLAIGLSLLDTTLKQLVLSGTGRGSEIAFQAAHAARDCGVYWARDKDIRDQIIATEVAVDSSPNPVTVPAPLLDFCIENNLSGTLSQPAANVKYAYYVYDWPNEDLCGAVNIIIFDAITPNADVTYDIAAYGDGPETCEAGRICTVVRGRGYNRACNDLGSIGAIQRSIFTQF